MNVITDVERFLQRSEEICGEAKRNIIYRKHQVQVASMTNTDELTCRTKCEGTRMTQPGTSQRIAAVAVLVASAPLWSIGGKDEQSLT
jgi:hypothetical protein